jgi:signal transduction histidine kinase
MKAIEIAEIFRRLQRSFEIRETLKEGRKPKGKDSNQDLSRGQVGLGTLQGKTKEDKASLPQPEETGTPAEEALKRLERENQLLYDQLVKAASMIRELDAKHLEASQKQRVGKVIVAGLLHDFRNPLAVIRSCTQFCLDTENLDPSIREKLRMILKSSQKAQDLSRQFLDYAKTSVLDFKPVNLNRLLLVIWKMSELESAPCQVAFDARLEKDLPEIMGSQETLERVFLNLFMNAIYTISKKGKVIVETRLLPSGDTVEIKVTDDGPGIPPEQQERIFEPFYTTKESGTGLGLSICQSIIQQHKGDISIQSTPGQGTTVTVRLPVLQDDPSERLEETALIR